MNKRQLEVIKSQMRDEERALKEIKQVYRKALKDVESNIQILRGRTDFENMQSIIYQTQYQEAIKAQIEARLDILNSQQFDKMSDYLAHCYESGYVGSMYDLHGQGIPIIAPIDEANVIRALQTDSKISGKLYTKLGADTKELKDSIRANLSRGFSSGADWNVIAKNLDSRMQIGFNRAARIIRTEGHRVRCEASFHAQQVAKSKGADIKKQWDATLDGRTRPNHRLLDGKIVEVDEPFEIDGNEAMYPGEFGIAREDVNCRCQALQRAKWALDEDELQILKDRAAFFNLDKTQDFEEFMSKYLQLPITAATAEIKPLLEQLADCKTTADVSRVTQEYFKNKPDCRIAEIDFQGCDMEVAKELGLCLDDLDNRYVSSVISVTTKQLPNSIGGQCTPTRESMFRYLSTGNPEDIECRIELNSMYLSSRSAVMKDLCDNNRSSVSLLAHGAWVDESKASVSTLVHEYGHSILPGKLNEILIKQGGSNGVFMGAQRQYRMYMKELRTIERDIMAAITPFVGQPDGLAKGNAAAKPLQELYDSTCISRYSKASVGEFIAEAFCDAECSSTPRKASVTLHELIVKKFSKGGDKK